MVAKTRSNLSAENLQFLKKTFIQKFKTVEQKTKLIQSFLTKPLGENFVGKDQLESAEALVMLAGPKLRNANPRWKNGFCAFLIMQIHGLLVKSETEKASHRQSARGKRTSKPKRTEEAQELMTFVAECETRVNSEQAQKAASRSAQIPKNPRQKRRVQDSMAFDPSNRESLACPKCRHQNVVTITSHEEVMQQNAAFKEEYNKKLKVWNDEGEKGKKPSLKSMSQQMACCCTKAHCLLSQNCGTCFPVQASRT